MLILVSVNDLRVRIPVGYYAEEIVVKTDVTITVKIGYETKSIEDDLRNTIDYQVIGQIIKKLSQSEFKLLETFAEKTIDELIHIHGHLNLKSVSVQLKKAHILESGIDAASHEVFVEKIIP